MYIDDFICKIQKMNNDLQWQKVLEWTQNENSYIIHIVTDQQQIAIEVQDKYSGDIWHSIFSSAGIEELTRKACNPKKYAVFLKMLVSALLRNNQCLSASIMSYKQLNNKFRKPGTQSKAITPEQASKRFLLLNYVSQFQKLQYPLPLMYFSDVSADRLKMSIKRLAQEMNLMREEQSEQELVKQNTLLKYQNEMLKDKLKGNGNSKMDSSMVLQPKMEQMSKEIEEKSRQINSLQEQVNEADKGRKSAEEKLKEAQQRVHRLEELLSQYENDKTDRNRSQKKMNFYQEKIQQLISQMNELSDELIFAQQKQKKSKLKIQTLEKELGNMMASKKPSQKKPTYYNGDSSPQSRKSEKALSIKSGRSNTSQKSLSKLRTNNNNNMSRKTYNNLGGYSNISNLNNSRSKLNTSKSKKQPVSGRKSSIYDSDTQSSKMRKMSNGRNSPYRQTTNINSKPNLRPTNQRSRSKSRQRVVSPPASYPSESQVMTEGFPSSSDDEDLERIEKKLEQLKAKKGTRGPLMNKNAANSNNFNKKSQSKLQKRFDTLQQMIRRTAESTRNKN